MSGDFVALKIKQNIKINEEIWITLEDSSNTLQGCIYGMNKRNTINNNGFMPISNIPPAMG